MAALKDSVTKENLLRAFAGECQAWRRYELAAGQAKNQKLQVLYWLFHYTANQEKEHAEIFYNHLQVFHGQEISMCANYPIDHSTDLAQSTKRMSTTAFTNPLGTKPLKKGFQPLRPPSI